MAALSQNQDTSSKADKILSSFYTSKITKLLSGGFGHGPNLTSSNFGTKILPSLAKIMF